MEATDNIKLILEAGQKIGSREIKTVTAPSGQMMALLPDAKDLIELNPRKVRPDFLKAAPTFQDWLSFVTYLNRFKSEDSLVFVESKRVDGEGELIGDYRMIAALDYHGAPVDVGTERTKDATPSHIEHSATLEFNPCIEWVRWLNIDGVEMDQTEFAEFVEENMNDVKSPDALVLLECAQNFSEVRNMKIVSKKVLSNGVHENTFSHDIQGSTETTTAKIPTKLELNLRPFAGFDAVIVTARLRYNVSRDGVLTFTVKLNRLSEVLEPAFTKIVESVMEATSLPMLVGKRS